MNKLRTLLPSEIKILQLSGCEAENWDRIRVAENFTPEHVSHVRFSGEIVLGEFHKVYELPGGILRHSGIRNCSIHNCSVGNNVYINNIHNYIANYDIDEECFIENTNSIVVDRTSCFGNGVLVPVMNEGGGREIPIFDHLSAPLAYILTLYRHRPKLIRQLQTLIFQYAEKQKSERGYIGKRVQIINCGSLLNVRIGEDAILQGCSLLENGSINSNHEAPVLIGHGVKCKDFILCSGVSITDSTLISRCFIGQGCLMGKHYSALDSLFFSNCQGMHGEATAVFAGPYTVSHHKSSLLIAGMFSFLNAGSGSNQSNHMYKLGPIHQGMAERGAKTTSDSYLLWPAKIGAFTLVMGRHTKHSDTSDLPFSYLIENATESYLVPAINLRSVGTIRDAQKWPKRDKRKDCRKLDPINFNLLSPYTIQKMLKGIEVLKSLQSVSGETSDLYIYQNCRITNSALKKGICLYEIAIYKFLGNSLISRLGSLTYTSLDQMQNRLRPDLTAGHGEWIDMSGLIAPKSEIELLLNLIEKGDCSLDTIQEKLEEIHQNYYAYEWTWAAELLEKYWKKPVSQASYQDVTEMIELWKESVVQLDRMIYEDAKKEFSLNARTGFGIDGDEEQKYLDFESVRGNFENNPFVQEVLSHIEKKTKLGNDTLLNLVALKNQL